MAAEIFFSLMMVAVFLLLFVLSVLGTILWVWMIIDCAKRKFKNDNDRVLWILVLVFAGLIGALIYYFVVKKAKR